MGKSMNKITKLLLPVALLGALSGCIIVADGDDWDDDYRDDNWRETQKYNREAIADLRLGSSIDEIRNQLGSPEMSEAVNTDGREFVILRYRTQHRHSDGDTTRDETTPLVFENDRLVGWGDVAIRSIPGL